MSEKKKNILLDKLNKFVKKYYVNQLIKGSIYVIAIILIFFLIFSVVEHFSTLGVVGRTILFWIYILLNFIVFSKLIIIPLLNLFAIGKRLNYKDAAKIIGKHFPEIDDKLVNVLELSELSLSDNELITASIIQKTTQLSPIPFKNAIDLSLNKKHLKWVFIPVGIVLLFVVSGKKYILTESSARIIHHNTFFEKKKPFRYIIMNNNLNCNQFEDFTLKVKLEGEKIPNEMSVKWGGGGVKLKGSKENEFVYKFSRVHSDINFVLSSSGYESEQYTIKALPLPKVVDMQVEITPPKHTSKKTEKIKQHGDLIVCEGSKVMWNIKLENTNTSCLILNEKKIKESKGKVIISEAKINQESNYSVILNNNNLNDTLTYCIKVIKDQHPKITIEETTYDTINENHLFSGLIQDDYLLKKLEFICSYKMRDSLVFLSKEVVIEQKNIENFFFTFNFTELNVTPGTEAEYYFKVWDNDGVNGSKFTKSRTLTYREASFSDLIQKKNSENDKTKSGINQSIELAKELEKDIENLNKKILEKKEIGWEERQKAKNIIKKQKALEKQIKNTHKKNSENIKLKEKINSINIEKQKELEELMNKVFDKEIKKILKGIEETLSKKDKAKLKELLEKLEKENINLDKELNRELELFKQLEFEEKIKETLEKISDLKKEQIKLKEKTKKNEANNNELKKDQESLSNQMDSLKKDLEDLRQKNMALEKKHEMPKTQKIEEEVKENMNKSKEALEKNMSKKSIKSQKKAVELIELLEDEIKDMQQESAENKPVENMESLRKILENLVTLSFDQEALIKRVKNTSKNNSDFIEIVQQQKKLSDNSRIIEDSLFALSKRVVQIHKTINEEIISIKSNMQKATKELEQRNVNTAAEKQQYVMTSINNLALLLSEILEQMQLEMPPSNCNTPKNCNKPNPNCKKPSLSELKKAQKALNKKMEHGKRGQKGKKIGESQSKELLELARQQEEIRNSLMEIRDEIGQNGEKGKIDKIINDMEENERDIINNKITKETINRQEEILTKLLEAENSEREQDEDDERESNEWGGEIDNTTKEFIKYKKKKRAQEELLRTTPVQLTPFYKNKVTKYFNRIIND